MKINDNRPLVTTTDAKNSVGTTVDKKNSNVNASETNTPSSSPAVNIGIKSSVTQTSNAVASTLTNQISETEALSKIRELIEKGEFKIDFPKIAEQMLKDAVSAIDRTKIN